MCCIKKREHFTQKGLASGNEIYSKYRNDLFAENRRIQNITIA